MNASSHRESELFNQGLLPYISKWANGSRKGREGCMGAMDIEKTSFLSHFILLIYLSIFNLKALKFIILIQAHDPIKFLVWKHVSNISKTTFIVRNKEGIDMKIHLYENQKISKSFLLSFVY